MTSQINTSGETLGTESSGPTRKVFTIIVRTSKTTLAQHMTEARTLTLLMDVSLRDNMMRLHDKPDCPFWNFDISGKIIYTPEYSSWLEPKHSVTIEDDGEPLIQHQKALSEDLNPILHVVIKQLGNPVPLFTGNAGKLKTKTHDGKKVTIGEVSY